MVNRSYGGCKKCITRQTTVTHCVRSDALKRARVLGVTEASLVIRKSKDRILFETVSVLIVKPVKFKSTKTLIKILVVLKIIGFLPATKFVVSTGGFVQYFRKNKTKKVSTIRSFV